MLNLYPRLAASFRSRNGDGDGDEDVSKLRAFYGIAVACVAVLLFCCVLAATSSVLKAGAFAATATLLLVVLGLLAPRTFWLRRRAGRPASPVLAITAARGGCPCAPMDAPAAFAYVCPLEEGSGGGGNEEEAVSTYVVICPVCLEGVHGGEMVRQLPACKHIFHVECIDMWLHSHRTCPMCRCVISSPPTVTAKVPEAEEAQESSDEALPPV